MGGKVLKLSKSTRPIKVKFHRQPTPIQRARIDVYVNRLIPRAVRTDALVEFLEKKGVCLFSGRGNTKGFFSHKWIGLFDAKTLGWKNYRADGAGKRGFFRADAVFLHELMHAIWALGDLSPGLKQAVYSLHAVESQDRKNRYFNYDVAHHYPEEWFCDQFPRALLFPSTCHPGIISLLRTNYFHGPLPNIKMAKGQS
jgi:hypothetical protein